MRYEVSYFYLATGMDGRADKKSYGIVEAYSPDAAIDVVVQREYPMDMTYGPNNSYSSWNFFRGCLSANEVHDAKLD